MYTLEPSHLDSETLGLEPSMEDYFEPKPLPVAVDMSEPNYTPPKPTRWLMRLSLVAIRWVALFGFPILRNIPVVNRFFPARGLCRVASIRLSSVDEEKLAKVTGPHAVTFLSPNHPEFTTDVLIDWEIGSRFSPQMGFIAAAQLVNTPLKPFWIRHNLIANTPGGQGRVDAVQCALDGHGLLVHPEGVVRWTGEHIYPLYPGVAQMALDALEHLDAAGDKRPVYIAPLVWRSHYVDDISDGLAKEMRRIEVRLGLPFGGNLDVGPRFFALCQNLLEHQEARFLGARGPVSVDGYFERQHHFLMTLLDFVEEKCRLKRDGTVWERIRRLESAVSRRRKALNAETGTPAAGDELYAALCELRRLQGFSPVLYHRKELTQEHMAESLKRIRHELYQGAVFDEVERMFPLPVASRELCVRVADPIDVRVFLDDTHKTARQKVNALLVETRRRMQAGLDEISAEIMHSQMSHAVPNPFFGSLRTSTAITEKDAIGAGRAFSLSA